MARDSIRGNFTVITDAGDKKGGGEGRLRFEQMAPLFFAHGAAMKGKRLQNEPVPLTHSCLLSRTKTSLPGRGRAAPGGQPIGRFRFHGAQRKTTTSSPAANLFAARKSLASGFCMMFRRTVVENYN